jgi:quercetin dioxygenase-like cupin family protein
MTTVNLNEIALNEFVGKEDASQHCKATFPLLGAHGSQQLATVYFELEPGDSLGAHIDSAEELIVVLDGHLEAQVGDEQGEVKQGEIILIPEMVLHNFSNIGKTKARILGVFGGTNHVVSTFEKEWLPTHSRVVDTALMFA